MTGLQVLGVAILAVMVMGGFVWLGRYSGWSWWDVVEVYLGSLAFTAICAVAALLVGGVIS